MPIKIRLGMDSYSIRATRWDAIQTLDYAAKIGLDNVQFSEFPHIARTMEKATDESFLKQVRAHAERLGIRLEMGTWGVCPTSRAFNPKYGTPQDQLGAAMRAATILGAATVRCVVGNQVERTDNGPIEKHIDAMIAVCKSVRDRALSAGLKIAIENHKELRAEEMRYIIEQAGPDYVGSCLDTGNPIWVAEHPAHTVEVLAPYAISSHFRDSAIWKHPRGALFTWTAMGDGNIGIDGVVREFARRCPNAPLNLEIITGRPPDAMPYLEPDFWKPFRQTPARDFTMLLARAEGAKPYELPHLEPNSPERQKADLERSVRYCREKLGICWRNC